MEEKFIKHYGTPRRSGRYPWGSGDEGYQRNASFIKTVKDLKDKGLTEVEIAKGMNMDTSDLRRKLTRARAEKRAADAGEALRLKEKGLSNPEIGRRMGGLNESSVRSLLDPALKARAEEVLVTADMLRNHVDAHGLTDIGAGIETRLGISRTKLRAAVSMLEEEGYHVVEMPETQVGTGKKTKLLVLAPESMSVKDVYRNRKTISIPNEYSEDGGATFKGPREITNLDRSRVHIRYDEEGGSNKDGVIEIRPGVDDISLGGKRYAQVRIGVDGKHYMKGMAMYSDDIPEGFDIIYNTNKAKGTPDEKVFKPMESDPQNPFGATFRQRTYLGKDGQEHISPINIVSEEGDWDTWSKSISSQVLSKQLPALAKKQLGIAYGLKKDEYDDIMSLTNPAVKKRLLESFADDADAASVHLKAAALPRQANRVILPLNSLRENEVYAPGYMNGENVVLIRHPHGGTFEIPEVIVNNKNPDGRKYLGDARDAIGIHPKTAQRLSGADFDGDTVIIIPNRDGYIRTSSPLKALENFEPKKAYPYHEGMDLLDDRTKQKKMGDISNLITDMTIKGANDDEIARAVRHSMVVIDAVKHKLDYKRSYIENNIADLKKTYQGNARGGASTLISKAKSPVHIPFVRTEGKYEVDPTTGKKKRVYIDPNTGEKLYEYKRETYTRLEPNKKGPYHLDPATGKKVYEEKVPVEKVRTTKIPKMEKEKDAYALSSGSTMEDIYAEHANALKALANSARKESVHQHMIPYSPDANKTYSKEVASLNAQLKLAFRNKPLERRAQLLANAEIYAAKKANPDMDPDHLKKIKGQALTNARIRVGAKKFPIEINEREWEAIQAGAVSNNVLQQILLNTDLDAVKQKAMPRRNSLMSPQKILRAETMRAAGYTSGEIADALGVSTSTLNKSLE